MMLKKIFNFGFWLACLVFIFGVLFTAPIFEKCIVGGCILFFYGSLFFLLNLERPKSEKHHHQSEPE
jgi:hypothetical protein